MQMHEVKQVTAVGTVKAANEHLADGWTLLAVVGVDDGVRYVFGRAEIADSGDHSGSVGMLIPAHLRR